MRSRVGLWLLVLPFAACAVPRDAYERAERALRALDLPGALVAFDEVPVSHPRYPEARAAALTVEQRMRRGHELLLEALLRRAEWRDREALVLLQQARANWPRMPGVEELITATSNRTRVLEQAAVASGGRVPIEAPELVPGAPVGESQIRPWSAAPGDGAPNGATGWSAVEPAAEGPVGRPGPHGPVVGGRSSTPAGSRSTSSPSTAATSVPPLSVGGESIADGSTAAGGPGSPAGSDDPPPVGRSGSVESPAPEASSDAASSAPQWEPSAPGLTIGPQLPRAGTVGEDPVAAGLVAVEARLGRGDLETAVAELIGLAQRYPLDQRVRLRLARVLHQRALQRYGQGRVPSAITDWERVVALDPDNAIARSQLDTARAEQDSAPVKR